MSAIPGLNPARTRTPELTAPGFAPSISHRPTWIRLILLLALVAAGAWAGYHYLAKRQTQSSTPSSVAPRTARVTTGTVRRVIRLTGSTTAKDFASIAAPRMRAAGEAGRALVLLYLVPSGSMVKKGDVVAKIDAQAMKDRLDDLEAQIFSAEADIKKRKAEIALNAENMLQIIRATKADLDKVKLEAAASEIRTPIDAEQLKLSVEEAEATYKEQLADLQSKKISDAANLRGLEITKEITVRQRDRFKTDIDKFNIVAPMSGLAVMQTIFRGNEMGQIQEGDQIAPGQPFMKIVDTNGIQVVASVTQDQSEEMRLGQPATIAFDAFPGMKLNGRVYTIGAIATSTSRSSNYLRSVPVYVKILERDSRVIPDLSTSTDVVVGESANALVIPQAAIEPRDGKWFVQVKNVDRYETREVKLGVSDHVRTAVLEGLREGEEVALGRPASAPLVAAN
jgi:HlyD family secretion protein